MPYPSVYKYIESFEGLDSTLDCAISELQRAEQDPEIAKAIANLKDARAILFHYKGKISQA